MENQLSQTNVSSADSEQELGTEGGKVLSNELHTSVTSYEQTSSDPLLDEEGRGPTTPPKGRTTPPPSPPRK